MNKFIITLASVALLLTAVTTKVNAQDTATAAPPSGELKCIFTGDFFFGAKYISASTGNTSTFTMAGYNPVILYKLSDRIFFEGEIEFQTSRYTEEANATSGNAITEGMNVEMEFANMGIVLNKYAMLRAGIIFTPYGVFEDWYHQRITNRFTSRPIGIGHGGLEPGADEGLSLNGGIPLGTSKLHYAVALLNGAKLISEQDNPGSTKTQNIGNLEYESIIDNNTNKALVARVGFLPFGNNCLEIGGWYGSQKVGAAKDTNANVTAVHSGLYLSFVQAVDPIKGTLTLRSQLSNLSIGDVTYQLASDTGSNEGKYYTFNNNKSSAYYAQLCYRPTMVRNKYLKHFEVGVRYGSISLADKAYGNWIMPGTTSAAKSRTQLALTLDYWLKWNAVIKISYEQNNIGKDPTKPGSVAPAVPPGTFFLQFAMGL
jgi:hypothetical protein